MAVAGRPRGTLSGRRANHERNRRVLHHKANQQQILYANMNLIPLELFLNCSFDINNLT